MGVEAGKGRAEGDPGGDLRRLGRQTLADHQVRQGPGDQGEAGAGGQGDQEHEADLSARHAKKLRLSAALQRRHRRRPTGHAQPDEHHVQRPVGETIACMIGADRALAHEACDDETVGIGDGQAHDQGQGDGPAIGGVATKPRKIEPPPGRQHKFRRQGDQTQNAARRRRAYQGRCAPKPHLRRDEAQREGAGRLAHIDQRIGGHLARGAPTLLGHLQQTAHYGGAKTGQDGRAQSLAEGQEPKRRRRRERQDQSHNGEGAIEGGEQGRAVGPFGLGHVKARHSRFDPGEEQGLDQTGRGEAEGIVAVLARIQQARESDDGAEARQSLNQVDRQIAKDAPPEHQRTACRSPRRRGTVIRMM